MSQLSENIVSALESVLGQGPQVLHEPRLDGSEKRYLADCVDSTFVSSVGTFVDRFETDAPRVWWRV